jgi:hypothetical protein
MQPVTQLAADASHAYDFVGSTTYVTLSPAGCSQRLRFSVTPRPVHTTTDGRTCAARTRQYSVAVRARGTGIAVPRCWNSSGFPASSSMTVSVATTLATGGNGITRTTITAISGDTMSSNWGALVSSDIIELPTDIASTVVLEALGGEIDVDSLLLTEIDQGCAIDFRAFRL